MAVIQGRAAASKPAAPQRSRRDRFLLILGVTLALLAFVVVLLLGSVVSKPSAPAQQTVVVAARDIPARAVIAAADLRLAPIPASTAVSGFLTSTSAAVGMVTQVPVGSGQPITLSMLARSVSTGGLTGAYLPIPTGYTAVAVPTGEQQGAAGWIGAGDHVAVVATVSTIVFGSTTPHTVSQTVFADLLVLRVGPAGPADVQPATAKAPVRAASGVATSLTLLVPRCDADYLSWLLLNGSLRYVLLSSTDYQQPPAADPNCSGRSLVGVGPADIDARWGFSKK